MLFENKTFPKYSKPVLRDYIILSQMYNINDEKQILYTIFDVR